MNNHLYYAFGSTSRHKLNTGEDDLMASILKTQKNSQNQKETSNV